VTQPQDRSDTEEEAPRVVIRDKRRLDPVTGQVREVPPSAQTAGEAGPPGGLSPDVQGGVSDELMERTADLQRLSAEYANYRRRVERDRVAVVEIAQDRVLAALLPVLDDVDRAREHGDLDGAFKAVAEQLVGVLAKLGLDPFGEPGEPFDPTRHEAVMHSTSPDVDGATCVGIMRRGYRRGDRVLRPAMVAVADPAEPAGETAAESGIDAAGGNTVGH
jgi:molecular chaperone GrpE